MQIELLLGIAAVIFLALLGALWKIYLQLNELLATLNRITSATKADTLFIKDRVKNIEDQLDSIYQVLKKPAPKDVKWEG